jgi:hypothetical protein
LYWYLFIAASGDNRSPRGIMKAVSVGNDPDNLRVNTFYFFPATSDQACYAHLIDAKASDEGRLQWDRAHPSYGLMKYLVEKDRLTVWPSMDSRAIEEAIADRKLKGKITTHGLLRLKHLQITETSDGLSRFLAGTGNKQVFPDKTKVVFERVK